jgi:hypothetical protein
MDYIFKEWEEKLKAFEGNVEKGLAEIRKCKADIQSMQVEVVNQLKKGSYVRDEQRLVLSAPEIIIGDVDPTGNLNSGSGATVIVRGTQVGLQGVGSGGQVELRASSIRQTAEDPGIDGQEHVVNATSEVVSQARNIILQSDDVDGAFSAPALPASGGGVRIHADKTIEIGATATAESREKRISDLISTYEGRKSEIKTLVSDRKESFKNLVKDIQEQLEKKEKITKDDEELRGSYQDLEEIDDEIESLSLSLSEEVANYAQALSRLAEVNRQIKCFKNEKSKIVKGDKFKKDSTGTSVGIAGEKISLVSTDGEGNYRDNEGAGVSILANEFSVKSVEQNGKLKKEGKINIQAKTVEVTTAGYSDKVEYDKDKGILKTADHAAEGDIILKSKNITLESMDYEVKDTKLKEKALTKDGKISVRAKTVEISTENSANVEVDDKGKLKKVNYTAEGDLIVRSKTVTVESVDRNLEDGKPKEKALTKDGKFAIRAEKMDFSATDTEGKATGSIGLNAKAINVRAMDVDKEKRTDNKLAAGSTMLLLAEKMYLGAKSKDIKSKKLQAVSEEVGAFADKTLEIQQGDGKALVQLAGGNASVGGSKTQIYGGTTINAKTEIKGELKAPKAAIDNLEAKSSFKSPNISDGFGAPGGGGGGSLSAKLKAEDAPKNT